MPGRRGRSRCRPAARSSTTSTLDTSTPAWAYGSIQDIGSRRGQRGPQRRAATGSRRSSGATRRAAKARTRRSIRANPNIVYSHGFYGNFTRDGSRHRAGAPRRRARPAATRGRGAAPPASPRSDRRSPRGRELRAQWMAPIVVSPHDRATIYAGYQFVFRSTDRGDALGADQRGSDATTIRRRCCSKSSNAIPYQTIVALAESPQRQGPALRRHRRRQAARDAGRRKTWTELTSQPADPQVDLAGRAVAARRRHRVRHAARPRRRRLRASTSTSRPTTARRSRASPATCRPGP